MLPTTALAATFDQTKGWVWLFAGLMLTLWWDVTGLDLAVMNGIASHQGFPLRHSLILETLLHDRARQAALLVLLAVALSAVFPWGLARRLTMAQRLEALGGILLALLAVSLIKNTSQTSCPWELEAFGGAASYVSHWTWWTADGGPGRCFPGGHASAGLAFMALAWPWLASPHEQDRRIGRRLLMAVLAIGWMFGAVQTLRGAHYPSHTLWTALICGAVTWAWHRLTVFIKEKVQWKCKDVCS